MYIALKTNTPEAELIVLTNTDVLHSKTWHAHKELSATLLTTIEDELKKLGASLQQIEGIICHNEGGSFTGLRIGVSVANALAAALRVPVVSCTSQQWQHPTALPQLVQGVKVGQYIQPQYDRPATTTQPKK
jgi:tRNA threonylcarbamoyladenosine biosynthesis protein TsaB